MRVFVAIDLCDAARESIAALQDWLRPTCNGVRWVRPELLHVTLRFVGEIADEGAAAVSGAVGAAASQCGPFAIGVEGCGCFPPRGPVRVLWAGIVDRVGGLSRCVEAIENGLERGGFGREGRAHSPHVTVGRVRQDRSSGAIRRKVEGAELRPVEQAVGSVVVMSSVLSQRGPTYTVISRAKLAGGGSPQTQEGTNHESHSQRRHGA